ncbi:hypothetical protein [Gluconobacter japonicus]|uniref:hypothetical protein n=1 Tax=Gluconobacter japonicus TaxID=376620 RepID=UPI000783E426|nr:hypothetical protein [Gluconobacter japonicus]KXV20421.1 hypothetical protein AD935_12015 [Gluconobacter japonicus]
MAAFRDYEAKERGFEQAKQYLIPRKGNSQERERALQALHNLVDELGPVVESYPSWHPLVSQHDRKMPVSRPSSKCGYEGLDHTIYFAHGFVTCPYGAAERVMSSVAAINVPHAAYLTADRLDAPLYSPDTEAVVVRCHWEEPLELGKFVPKRVAVGLMLDREIPNWHHAEVGESWETMRGYFLGTPHGARSSLFVSQETAMAMKRIWIAIIESGVFGPVYY